MIRTVAVTVSLTAVALTAGCTTSQSDGTVVTTPESTSVSSAAPTMSEIEETLSWTDTGDGKLPAGITFPAVDDATYEFSDQPQGAEEQWIADNHPRLWDSGVRALVASPMWNPGAISASNNDWVGALVQYIDGERFEGTEKLPLAFDYADGDPDSFPADLHEYNREVITDRDNYDYERDRGVAAYALTIHDKGTNATELRYRVTGAGAGGVYIHEPSLVFAQWQDAWEWIQDNGFKTGILEGDRPLHPGEITGVTVAEDGGERGMPKTTFYTLNPSTGDLEKVK